MKATLVAFGLLEIEGERFDHDVVIEQGSVRRRKKRRSKAHRQRYGHTPLSPEEKIPWSAARLIVGTGARGQLPIMAEVFREAARRGVELVAVPTAEACELLASADPRTVAAILHVTC